MMLHEATSDMVPIRVGPPTQKRRSIVRRMNTVDYMKKSKDLIEMVSEEFDPFIVLNFKQIGMPEDFNLTHRSKGLWKKVKTLVDKIHPDYKKRTKAY